MQRSIRSAGTVLVAALITSAFSPAAATVETDNRVQPKPATAAATACSLLTKEDAATALGEAVKGPEAKTLSDAPGGAGETITTCEYVGSGLHRVQLNLTRLAPKTAPMYRAMCAEKKSTDLAGMGDVACWYSPKHEELHALKGTAFLAIELRRSGNPTEAIKGVMKGALAGMR